MQQQTSSDEKIKEDQTSEQSYLLSYQYTLTSQTLPDSAKKLWDNAKKFLDPFESEFPLYIPLEGKNDFQDDDVVNVINVLHDFFSNKAKVMLILGDSGAGKTSLVAYLVKTLWRQTAKNQRIPLWISLARYIELENQHPDCTLIEAHLREQGLTASEINHLKSNYSFIIFLDDYHKIPLEKREQFYQRPFYLAVGLGNWQGQVVITCHSQLFNRAKNYKTLFYPVLPEIPSTTNFIQRAIFQIARSFETPASNFQQLILQPFNQRQIEAYVAKYTTFNDRNNFDWSIKKYLQCLSEIVDKNLMKNPRALKCLLTVLPDLFKNHPCDAIKYISEFNIRMLYANHLRYQQVNQLTHYNLFGDALSNEYSEAEAIFQLLVTNLEQPTKENEDAVIERLNSHLLNDKFEVITLLIQEIANNYALQDLLFQIVKRSANEEQISCAAANAMTLLAAASVIFSRKNLQNVRIPHAVLSHGIFYKTDFRGADLRGVAFQDAFLKDAKFTDCLLDGCVFDEKSQTKIFSIVCYSAKGQYLAIGGHHGMAVYHQPEHEILFVGKRIKSIAFDPSEQMLAIGSFRGEIWLYELVSGKEFRLGKVNNQPIRSVTFHPTKPILVSGSDDAKIRLWDLISEQVTVLLYHLDYVSSIAFHPAGQQFASASHDLTIWLSDMQGYQQKKCLTGHNHYVMSIAFSPDGRWLASASMDQTVRVWDMNNMLLYKVLDVHVKGVNNITFSSDGKCLASASDDRTIIIWNFIENGKVYKQLGTDNVVHSVAFKPGATQLLSGNEDGTVRLWSQDETTKNWKLLRTLKPDSLYNEKAVQQIARNKYRYNFLPPKSSTESVTTTELTTNQELSTIVSYNLRPCAK